MGCILRGIEIGWFDNGKKWYEERRIQDKQHGLEMRWYESGIKWREEIWRQGEKHGVYTTRRENGQKEYEIYHNHNQEYARIEYNERKSVTRAHFSIPNTHNHNQGKQKLKGKSY